MAELSEEERKILRQAEEIKDRQMAEKLEAGEISLEEVERINRREMQNNAELSGARPASGFAARPSVNRSPSGRPGNPSGSVLRRTGNVPQKADRASENAGFAPPRGESIPQNTDRGSENAGFAPPHTADAPQRADSGSGNAGFTVPRAGNVQENSESGSGNAGPVSSSGGAESTRRNGPDVPPPEGFESPDFRTQPADADAGANGGKSAQNMASPVSSKAESGSVNSRRPAARMTGNASENRQVRLERTAGRDRGQAEDFSSWRLTKSERKDLEKYEKARRKRIRREEKARAEEERRRPRNLTGTKEHRAAPPSDPARAENRRPVRKTVSPAQNIPQNAASRREPGRPVPGNPAQNPGRKKKSVGRKLLHILLVILLILVLLLAALLIYMRVAVAATNYKAYDPAQTRSEGVYREAGVTNVLLIGTDNREEDDASRSDAMIVMSVNNKKNKIVLTSILRDSYVQIPGYGQNRLNHAYQMGGAPLLITTIENNFGIAIDYYVKVDFYSFIDVIDAFGGVYLTITQEELPYVIGYVSELNHIEGLPEGTSFPDHAGYQLCDGRQALGYSRIRYIGTDFGRTERQRTVLEALMKRVKQRPWKIFEAMNRVFPDLTTNISDNRMEQLFLQMLPPAISGRVSQFRVPADGCWSNALTDSGQEVLSINFEQNNALLKSAVYD